MAAENSAAFGSHQSIDVWLPSRYVKSQIAAVYSDPESFIDDLANQVLRSLLIFR